MVVGIRADLSIRTDAWVGPVAQAQGMSIHHPYSAAATAAPRGRFAWYDAPLVLIDVVALGFAAFAIAYGVNSEDMWAGLGIILGLIVASTFLPGIAAYVVAGLVGRAGRDPFGAYVVARLSSLMAAALITMWWAPTMTGSFA